MKRIVSISLGSSSRDHRAEVEFCGEKLVVERIGTDGDLEKAIGLIKSLDGQVAAFGMGGIDLYLVAGEKRYVIRDAARIAKAARQTPIMDGSGLKNTLERRVVQYLAERLGVSLPEKRVLMVSAVDRFGMAEAFDAAGCRMVFGDLLFALGIPIPLRTLKGLRRIANAALPVITRLPFTMLYPTGSKQEENSPKYRAFFEEADIIAGDFLYIKKYMPPSLQGKIIVTNTVTAADLAELKRRGAAMLVTSTPEFGGRSFGTNVIEALLVSCSGKRPAELTEADYLELLDRLHFEPRVVRFG
ncbi:hypothetical protein EDC14_100325 [Hydrogenispora ethanolica]|uniref:Quinate 5-dehydrogenase n=1 Tax=Hydrogenispora ethanolica TaxID=1082276 RepID=A0A4R1S6W6_HYDET|nr:quinate 5-dehydrogenase [Hydrogenispora ethanolica]TCL75095.1 hypothetical protein EDC14_100325 [Hydrogenispora ethanolica]